MAGGSGQRMQRKTPKQFLLLADKPILMHTLAKFYQYDPQIIIILVLPKDMLSRWQQLCIQYTFTIPHQVTIGGDTRFQSVKNGLATIQQEGWVAIHDGVRPLVAVPTIQESFRIAQKHGNAVTAVPLKDSIRKVIGKKSEALHRQRYRLVQTPQTFSVSLIKEAYQIEETLDLTDDASVAEKAGFSIHLLEGTYQNIKITTPEDLLIAEALYKTP